MPRDCPFIHDKGSRKGRRCGATSLKEGNGYPWCWWHDPAKDEERNQVRLDAAKKAGRMPKGTQATLPSPLHVEVLEVITPEVLERGEPDPSNLTPTDIKSMLGRVFVRIYDRVMAFDEINHKDVYALSNVGRSLLDAARTEYDFTRQDDHRTAAKRLWGAVTRSGASRTIQLAVLEEFEADPSIQWTEEDSKRAKRRGLSDGKEE